MSDITERAEEWLRQQAEGGRCYSSQESVERDQKLVRNLIAEIHLLRHRIPNLQQAATSERDNAEKLERTIRLIRRALDS